MKRNVQADLEICQLATPGPWKLDKAISGYEFTGITADEYGVNGPGGWIVEPSSANDFYTMAFIAASKEALPYWINEAVRLEAENARLRKVVEAARVCIDYGFNAKAHWDNKSLHEGMVKLLEYEQALKELDEGAKGLDIHLDANGPLTPEEQIHTATVIAQALVEIDEEAKGE